MKMKCPKCGAMMGERVGRYGRFLGCSKYPRCNGSRDLEPSDVLTTRKPTRRRSKFTVVFPETVCHAFRERERRPCGLSIYSDEAV
jgi:ssDNA-binding Zn-finger/Zn-ribbon topoisomerase 1